jgi:hypothetical protein
MLAGMGALSPAPFKAKKKDPEKMLADFNIYVKLMKDYMMLTDNHQSADAKKKAMMRTVGGPDMIWLFEYIGKVLENDTYDGAVQKVEEAITGQTNQAVMKYRLFTGMAQGDQAFASWWSSVKEAADRCNFTGYNRESAARDAILYQTSNPRLRKKILAEDPGLEETVKNGLAYEQSESKAKVMEGNKAETGVNRIDQLEDQVARLLHEAKQSRSGSRGDRAKEGQCQTCANSARHRADGQCQGKQSKECYKCGKPGHFKGAPVCKGDTKVKRPKEQRKGFTNRRIGEPVDTDDDTESGSEGSDLVPRLKESGRGETVAAAKERQPNDPMVMVAAKPVQGKHHVQIKWLADSGVNKTLLSEADWAEMVRRNPGARLNENKVKFTPYGTDIKLPVIGKAEVVLKNAKGRRINTTVYVMGGKAESLLGNKDGTALGIINIDPEGSEPEKVRKMAEVIKLPRQTAGVVSGGETQQQIDRKMSELQEGHKKLFEGIGKADIPDIHIHTREGVKPVVQKLRTVAQHYMVPLKKHLDELLEAKVIEGPLGSEHATGWVSNVVITAKKYDASGGKEEDRSKIRVNLDMRLMEQAVKMVHFPIPTAEQLRHEFEGSDRYSVIDLNHAFHQFQIDEESSKLFVFTTPYGLFRYRRLPMGTPPASAECHTKLKELLKGLKGVVQIKDDVVIHGRGREHDERLGKAMQRLEDAGLTLRREKCKFGRQEVLWFGNIFSKQGMSPDPEKVSTIKAWPVPKDKAEVKSFLQTVQFSGAYMKPKQGTYSDVTKPLRDLTRQGVWFKWTKECEDSFKQLKDLLCDKTVLVCYDPKRFTRLYVDHGPEGVASTVAQRYDTPGGREPEYRPVAYSSRSLKEAEKHYSKVEGESLAVLSGCMTNRQYLYGTRFEVVVDHKPLVPLYNTPNRPGPVRVDRHKSKLRAFTFKVTYEPGSTTPADYGSRHPPPDKEHTKLEREEEGIEDEQEDQEFSINRLIEDDLPEAVTRQELKEAMAADEELSQVIKDVKAGRASPDTAASQYGKVYEELTAEDGLLLKGERLVIPPKLQAQVIALSHEGHGQGETKTISLLRERVWWPRMGRMAKEYVATCIPCAAAVPGNAPAPMKPIQMPEEPWHTVHCDFKGPIGGPRGYYFHVTIDAHSRWPVVAMVTSTSFEKLEPVLDEMWATYGIPEKVVHDGGPPYESHNWRRHARRMGFKSVTCTPEHPQSNGLAEKFMATVVKVTHAARAEYKDPRKELQKYLMVYRATPHSTTGKSPSEMLQNRRLRLKLPGTPKKPETPTKEARRQEEAKRNNENEKDKQKEYVDRRRRAKEKEVQVGDEVLIKQKKTTLKPPWDPRPLKVTEIKGTQITARRGPVERTRNVEKFKILKKRPESLRTRPETKQRRDDSDDEDWLEEKNRRRPQEAQPDQQEQEAAQPDQQEREAEEGHGPPLPESSTDEDEPFHGWDATGGDAAGEDAGGGEHREVAKLRDQLTEEPARMKRESKKPKRLIEELEKEREQGHATLEREVSQTDGPRSNTPGTSPGMEAKGGEDPDTKNTKRVIKRKYTQYKRYEDVHVREKADGRRSSW